MVSIFDLCFSYTEEPPYLLNHLSLDIPAGAYWSVVGPNGAGKSTFIKLVLGLLNPLQAVLKFQPKVSDTYRR